MHSGFRWRDDAVNGWARARSQVARRKAPTFHLCALAILACALAHCPPAAEASIKVELSGIDDGPARDNVIAYLSLKRYATLDDLSPDTVERIFHRADGEIADALRPFGYYEPKLDATLTADGKNWIARLAITPGRPVMLTEATVDVEGPGAGEPFLRELTDAKPLRAGQQLNHGDYEHLKTELQQRAAARGYLDAHYTRSELAVDPKQWSATATLTLDTGPRYRFGDIVVEQDAIKPALVMRYLRFHKGDWYDSGALLRTQFALDDTQYFRIVEVLPGDRDPATLTVPVRVDARRNNLNKYTIGVGYETDYGARVRFVWYRRLTNDSGHRLRFEANLAENNKQVTATYVVPIGDPALEKAQLDLTGSDEILGDARVKTLALRPSVTHVRGGLQRVMFADVTRTESIAGGVATRDSLIVPGISFSPVPPGFAADSAILSFDPGWFAELLGSAGALGANSNFLRLHLRDQWRFKLTAGWYLLARAELGTTMVKNFDDLPTQYRFFAGGDRSVRGFAFNSLSPVEIVPGTTPPQELRTGGKDLAVGSLEIEHDLPRHFAVALFTDVGNAFNHFGDPLEYSAGIGVRYKLPFVGFGIDIAQPLSRTGSPRLHLNVSPIF
jgi:translocation and assembly module TamA